MTTTTDNSTVALNLLKEIFYSVAMPVKAVLRTAPPSCVCCEQE
jgi:hypothetical protein